MKATVIVSLIAGLSIFRRPQAAFGCLSRFQQDTPEKERERAFSAFMSCVIKQQAYGRAPDICYARHNFVLISSPEFDPEFLEKHTELDNWQSDVPGGNSRVVHWDHRKRQRPASTTDDEEYKEPMFIAFQT